MPVGHYSTLQRWKWDIKYGQFVYLINYNKFKLSILLFDYTYRLLQKIK